MRLRMAKDCLSALRLNGILRDDRTVLRDALEQLRVLRRKHDVDAGAENADGPALCRKRALMRRGVNAARAAAHDGDADIRELIRELARRLDAVMRRHAASRPSPRRSCLSRSSSPLT